MKYTPEQFAALPAWARAHMIDLENRALHAAVKRAKGDPMSAHLSDIAGKVREIAALLDSNTTDPDGRVSEAATMTDLASEIQTAAGELEIRFWGEYQNSKDLAQHAENKGAA